MTTRFFLILTKTARPCEYELVCAISGDADGWRSTPRYISSRDEVESELSRLGVVAPVGPNQLLSAAASNIPVAFALDSAKSAIDLQLLHRVDIEQRRERTMVTFNDLSGSYPNATAHYKRDRPIEVGDLLDVDTGLGMRSVKVLAIKKNELVPYGSDDTRREVFVDVRF